MKKFIKFLFVLLSFSSFCVAQDVKKNSCPGNLYPNVQKDGTTKCNPCLRCHQCINPKGKTEYCSDLSDVFTPAEVMGDAFLADYVYSEGKMILEADLDFKKGGTILFQVVATNSSNQKVIPAFMKGVKLSSIRNKKVIETAAIDQNGRVKFAISPISTELISITGIKGTEISIPLKKGFELPVQNALSDFMFNEKLTNLSLEIVAFTPTGTPAVDFGKIQPSALVQNAPLTDSTPKIQICKSETNVECPCGNKGICGKDKDACCRICDFLRDGTYSKGCNNAVIHKKTESDATAKPKN